MSYWDDAQNCLNEFVASGSAAILEENRHHALRQLNLLHTDLDVMVTMKNFYEQVIAVDDCLPMLFDTANAQLLEKGVSAMIPKGTELIHFAASNSFNSVAGATGHLAEDFRENFPTYMEARVQKGRTLWIAENCHTATSFNGICAAAKQLGLYHLGLLTPDIPLVAFHLKTTREVAALKPTWAHAFANWYFDPAPESCHHHPAHGWARCLETGQLLRKEWVVRPVQMKAAFEVVAVYLSHEVDEISPMPDFNRLGASYWGAVEARVKQLQVRLVK
jgi:hypothetical protein